jgi:hypothetical protein
LVPQGLSDTAATPTRNALVGVAVGLTVGVDGGTLVTVAVGVGTLVTVAVAVRARVALGTLVAVDVGGLVDVADATAAAVTVGGTAVGVGRFAFESPPHAAQASRTRRMKH